MARLTASDLFLEGKRPIEVYVNGHRIAAYISEVAAIRRCEKERDRILQDPGWGSWETIAYISAYRPYESDRYLVDWALRADRP